MVLWTGTDCDRRSDVRPLRHYPCKRLGGGGHLGSWEERVERSRDGRCTAPCRSYSRNEGLSERPWTGEKSCTYKTKHQTPTKRSPLLPRLKTGARQATTTSPGSAGKGEGVSDNSTATAPVAGREFYGGTATVLGDTECARDPERTTRGGGGQTLASNDLSWGPAARTDVRAGREG